MLLTGGLGQCLLVLDVSFNYFKFPRKGEDNVGSVQGASGTDPPRLCSLLRLRPQGSTPDVADYS